MPGNPKDSEWYQTPRSKRRKRALEMTIEPELRTRLDLIAKRRGMTRTALVEEWIRNAELPEAQ